MTEKNTAKFTLKLCQNVFSIILSLHLSQCKHLGHYYWTCVVMTRIFSGRWQWDPNWQRDEHHDIEILECITVRTLCLLYKGWELHWLLMHKYIHSIFCLQSKCIIWRSWWPCWPSLWLSAACGACRPSRSCPPPPSSPPRRPGTQSGDWTQPHCWTPLSTPWWLEVMAVTGV